MTRHRDSPRVRRLAREAGVDLAGLHPTGAHGRATPADVERARRDEGPAVSAASEPSVVPSPSSAHVTPAGLLLLEVVLGSAHAEVADLVVAVARAGEPVAELRGAHGRLDVSVRGDDGAVVVRDATLLSRAGVEAALAAAEPDDEGVLLAVSVREATGGVTVDVPAPQPGRAAVVGLGPSTRRPVVVHDRDGQELIGIRSVAWLSLAYDPGVLSPAAARRLLPTVGERLQHP